MSLDLYETEYQKIINVLDDQITQSSKFRTKKWVEINDQSNGVYRTNSQIKFKTTMLKLSLCGYSDTCILVKRRITITGTEADAVARRADERSKGVIFKSCTPFNNYISKINNTKVDNAKDLDVVMQRNNLIEYGDNYSETSGSLWQYYTDEPNATFFNNFFFLFQINNIQKINKMKINK